MLITTLSWADLIQDFYRRAVLQSMDCLRSGMMKTSIYQCLLLWMSLDTRVRAARSALSSFLNGSLAVVEASPFQICCTRRTLAQKIWFDYPWPWPKDFLSRQALGFLWLPKIQHADPTPRFQVSIVELYVFVYPVRLFLYLRLICICLRFTKWPVCGMCLLRLPGGMVCVSWCTHASCIPRVVYYELALEVRCRSCRSIICCPP